MKNALVRHGVLSAAEAISPFLSDTTRDVMADWLAKGLKNKVTTYQELAERDDVRIWWFSGESQYEFDLPEYYDTLPPEIERLLGKHACQSPFVMEVPDVVLSQESGFKVTENGKYIVFNFWEEQDPENAARGLAYDFMIALGRGSVPALNPETGGDVEEVDVAVSLLSKHATNYTHWVQDCLALLEGVEEYVERTGNEPLIVIPNDPPSFIPDSLEAMGYTDDQYREMSDDRIRVHRLVMPSIRRCLSDTSDDYFRMISGIEWVRNRALQGVDTTGADEEYSSKVLISRRDAETRRIVNREEVIARLSEMGFELYAPGEMSYREQVRLFSQAKFVVGAHGAGMINAIYATDVSVLELYGSHYLPANYELAQGLGFRYGCLECEPVDRDMKVDVEELVSAVHTIESTRES